MTILTDKDCKILKAFSDVEGMTYRDAVLKIDKVDIRLEPSLAQSYTYPIAMLAEAGLLKRVKEKGKATVLSITKTGIKHLEKNSIPCITESELLVRKNVFKLNQKKCFKIPIEIEGEYYLKIDALPAWYNPKYKLKACVGGFSDKIYITKNYTLKHKSFVLDTDFYFLQKNGKTIDTVFHTDMFLCSAYDFYKQGIISNELKETQINKELFLLYRERFEKDIKNISKKYTKLFERKAGSLLL